MLRSQPIRFSFLSHLECSGCGEKYAHVEIHSICRFCMSPLLARYDLPSARDALDRDQFQMRRRGMWRWRELLPVLHAENELTLGEGDTPLLSLPRAGKTLGLTHLHVKDESANPTLTFKARGLAAAVSKARELGVEKLIIPTAGNAGGALAAYAARGGLRAHVVMPKDTPLAILEETRAMGAEVELVDGLISDAAALALERAREEGWFDLSTFREPYRLEGKKIVGYELAEGFGWELPEVIICPTGGGTGLVGIWKAFAELETLGWLKGKRRPRMVAVQADGCAPVVKAFAAGASACETWTAAHTIAAGLRVPKPYADRLILHDIYDSNGSAIAVSDGDILEAQQELATMEGILAAPEGAAALAAARKLIGSGWLHPEERVVFFNTGSGMKYLDLNS